MPIQERSQIKIEAPKIPILFCSDFGDTGFGTVGAELTARWAQMEIFDVHYHGWHAKDDQIEAFKSRENVTVHKTNGSLADHTGSVTFDEVVKVVQPKVVISLGDPWMIDYIKKSEYRDFFSWIAYVPIDRDTISQRWKGALRAPDVLALYSKFGMETIDDQVPLCNTVYIPHGVDRMCFKEYYADGMGPDDDIDDVMQGRKSGILGAGFADKFIVGFVGRNQVRKNIPGGFAAFKAFNCATWCERQDIEFEEDGEDVSVNAEEFCPNRQKFRCEMCPAFQQRPETEHSMFWLHTTPGSGVDRDDAPGVGWNIEEMATRFGLDGKVGITPGITALKGLPREALAMIMNCFDVHLFMSHSEGFGLPIAETLACGVPNVVTDYSSMSELVSDGGGYAIEPIAFSTYTTWENPWAIPHVGKAADKINELFLDKELYTKTRKDAVKSKMTPHWDVPAMQFRDIIQKLAT
jgi:glycosyltransferase involved in cell wall biosynthesis